MRRELVFPDFRAEDLLFEDDDVVFVNKPAGVPSQAADAERADDLPTRVGRFLAAREGRSGVAYLGVHQRLDQDTSGVVVFARSRRANASLAQQFEGRAADKEYLAAVTGWNASRKRATLDDWLAKGQGGEMEVVRGERRRGASRAVTHVELVERRGDRALLRLRLETGRTHQARVQLAAAGAPIAGDTIYGGASAPRLMLHASALRVAHPVSGARLSIEAREPELLAWTRGEHEGAAVYDDADALRRALRRAVERRYGLGWSGERDPEARRTTAYRLVHEDADGLPELAVDVYGAHLVAQLYGTDGAFADPARRVRLLDALDALGFDGIYLKVRPKQANVVVDTRRDDLAPALPVRGAAAPAPLEILEEGTSYLTRLGDGLSTGIFLDQRHNRRMIREVSAGTRFLNLFSYTCGFTVAAARGGARHTVSVDASAAALERGIEGLRHVGAWDPARHAMVAEDAFGWLEKAARRGERFDLVALDPPSYSSTKRRRFVAASDYPELVALAASVLSPGGRLLASCNHRGMSRAKLRRAVIEGARRAGRPIAQAKDLPTAPDFRPPAGAEPHMKSVLLTLAVGEPRPEPRRTPGKGDGPHPRPRGRADRVARGRRRG